MKINQDDVFIGLAFVCFGFILLGLGYKVYAEQSKVVALCGIPAVILIFVGGILEIIRGFKK